MRKLTFVAIGLSFFLLFSCAAQKAAKKKPLPKFQGMVLTTAIDDSGTVAVPLDPTNEFETDDDQIAALLSFENVTGHHQLRWEWNDPSGKIYFSTENFPMEVEDGKYLSKVTTWHQISLKGEAAAELKGDWTVKVFVDDELVDSKPFNLKQAFVDPLKLPEGVSIGPNPKSWGLIIGIEDYSRLPKVEYARKDALIVREYFNRILGVPEENIISLLDADATKASIEGYLKKYIPNNVENDATLYVYFAGHGMPGLTKGEPYLVPYDADTRFIEQSGYKLISFYQDLYLLDVERVYVFLDSCFSGMASRAAELLIKGARPALVHVEEVRPPANSIISLNATSTGQISNAFPEMRHGLFTYYLLRGMQGEADFDEDGWTSMKEVYGYVRNRVNKESRRLQSEQTPSIVPPSDLWKDIKLSRSTSQQ